VGLRDLESFMRERASVYDSSLDTTAGSPFDSKVIQPLLRRVGIDPFTVDLVTFLITRLKQAYPRMALNDGDNLTDLLVKANSLLWDPIVRETARVQRNLSLQDPTTLTLDEADSLGGNFFIPRRRGRYSRGVSRILFGSPSNQSINQNNFFTSRGGLVFFPTELQSIRTAEMALNVTDGNLYYFDVNVIAERPGTAYDIGPNELSSVANIPGAVRVMNLSRFKFGEEEENVVDYVARVQKSLGEKSLVTLRGIAAKVLEAFSDVNRLNVVGFNDPEMQRDVIRGGGLGPILASGKLGRTAPDGEGQAKSRRFVTDETDFSGLINASSVITIVGDSTVAGDYVVRRFVSTVAGDSSIDLESQELVYGESELRWFLRRRELTLSGIPGGILYPNGPNGEVTIPSDSIHIGGANDIHVRTSDFDEATLTITNVTDDAPILSGISALETVTTGFTLSDYTLPLDAAVESVLAQAEAGGWTIQVFDGPNAGAYRVLQRSGNVLTTSPAPALDPVPRRWRLFDVINLDLNEPKETKLVATDLVAVQGNKVVRSGSGLNYLAYSVAKDDVLRVLEGEERGDYIVEADPNPLTPDRFTVTREFSRSFSDGSYIIFTPGAESLDTPLIRVRSVELLDSSSQPQGSFVPYAKPVDVQSRSFQNPARGVKHSLIDVQLGLVSAAFSFPLTVVAGANVFVLYLGGLGSRTVTVTVAAYATLSALVAELNNAIEAVAGVGYSEVVTAVDDSRFGIRPVGNGFVGVTGGNGQSFFFGDIELRTTADIRSDAVLADGGWGTVSPLIDYTRGLDVLQVLDGRNVGFYSAPFILQPDGFPGLSISQALVNAKDDAAMIGGEGTYFSPEVRRSVNIGTRSVGSVRVYFLEPTSFEVTAESTVFSLDLGESGIARFIPDPTLGYQLLPPLPDGEPSNDASTQNNGGNQLTASSQNFILSGVHAADVVVIDYWPVKGSTQLTVDPIVGLAGKVFRFSIDDGPERVLTFIRDDTSIPVTDVTIGGMVDQINAIAGVEVASVDADDRLQFEANVKFSVKKDGTPVSSYPLILGNLYGHAGTPSFSTNDINNVSPHAGEYEISSVSSSTQLLVSPAFPIDGNWASTLSGQSFKVMRNGTQRITTTAMSENDAGAGLYYFDVELISEGAGDFWNIDADQQLTVDGYKSDGYYLVTDDSNLTFSESERVKMVISRTILEQGVDDDPQNATQITGQNLHISYDRVQTIENLQSFIQSDTERVVCSSPLARHLIPHFVRFDISYTGGSKENIVLADIEKYVKDLFPVDTLDASDLQSIITARGASYVKNPIDLLAVVHRVDRSIWIQRSQDRLSTTRLAAFIPDAITVTRSTRAT